MILSNNNCRDVDLTKWRVTPMWCNVVHPFFRRSQMLSQRTHKTKLETASAPRTSVSFPPELYRTLEQLAKQKKVSLAWLVREAAEKYVADQWPLFAADSKKNITS
jgi:predicted DNA-binding protein